MLPTGLSGRLAGSDAVFVSIVITNHNYGTYVARAIESALAQTYPRLEVIVIDDASTDGSRDVISRYADRVTPLFNAHSGQLGSTNAGFAHTRGDIVIFLDADDVLYPDAVARHVARLKQPGTVKSQGVLRVVDADGRPVHGQVPVRLSPAGDYRERFMQYGPRAYFGAFTSGNAWHRRFLERVMPLPEQRIGLLGPDGYLGAVDALFGRIEVVDGAVGDYRVHGCNIGPVAYRFDADYLRARLLGFEERVAFAARHARAAGYEVDVERWLALSGWKLVLARHLLSLWGEDARAVDLGTLCRSPFTEPDPNIGKALVRAVQLALIGVLPDRQALHLARRVFDASWGRAR